MLAKYKELDVRQSKGGRVRSDGKKTEVIELTLANLTTKRDLFSTDKVGPIEVPGKKTGYFDDFVLARKGEKKSEKKKAKTLNEVKDVFTWPRATKAIGQGGELKSGILWLGYREGRSADIRKNNTRTR